MKTICKLSFLMLAVAFTACQNEMDDLNNWDYPVKPGSAEWAALSSHDEMLEVCRIPDIILKVVTTEELVELCLNYPLQVDFFVRNSLQEGLERVSAQFNGLQELFNRKDNDCVCLGC